jgi:predicted SAM-dependent methyltransferase
MTLLSIISEVRWITYIIKRKVAVRIYKAHSLFVKTPLPQNPDGRVLVHLGCGDVVAPGFINIDFKPAPHVHFVHNVTDLPFLDNGSVDLVYACHVMEHFPIDQVKNILWEWRRVLKDGGVVRLSVPDFEKLLEVYFDNNKNVESIRPALMGDIDGYNSHLLLFNYEFLQKTLEDNGFRNVRRWSPELMIDHGFEDWASKSYSYGGKNYHISLNVEADKC